ncbi:MAG: pyridoxal-phosphate dependent enzyme [Akkermansiaceae bacterium]
MSKRDLIAELQAGIHQARARVYRVGESTPLQEIELEGVSNPVWVKREDLGPVKAYKWRGAFNAMACLSPAQRAAGVVAASAGNHAQGIAIGARVLSCQAVIFMPRPTPIVKQKAVMAHGGEGVTIRLVGDRFSEAQEAALAYAKDAHAPFIPPYDSIEVMAGQGTLADEIFTSGEGPFDRVYVAVGGGGLASAVATWLKSSWPGVKVIGVEGVDQASMSLAFQNGGPVGLDYVDLFCDGTAVTQVGELTYEICRSQLDEIITVTNEEVAAAIKAHWDGLRVIPEPSGAMSLAGFLKEQRSGVLGPEEKILTILCGANMDFAKVAEISRRAGIDLEEKRSFRFLIPEEKGSLIQLLDDLPAEVSITDLQYGRTATDPQQPVLSLDISKADEKAFDEWMSQRDVMDATNDPQVRYRTIPFSRSLFVAPLFVEIEFRERAGALLGFMKKVSPLASLCYFNYRYSGEQVGRALLGLDFASEDERDSGRRYLFGEGGSGGQGVRSVKEVEFLNC